MSNRLVRNSTSLFQWLLRLYPVSFRAEFSLEMVEVFRCQCQDAFERQSLRRLLRVWLVTLILFPPSIWQAYRLEWPQRRSLILGWGSNSKLDTKDFDAIIRDFPQFAVDVLFNMLLVIPGGPLVMLLFNFIVGGVIGAVFNDYAFGVLFALFSIPAFFLLLIIGGLISAFFFTFARAISQRFNNRFDP